MTIDICINSNIKDILPSTSCRISLILREIHESFYYLCLFHMHPDNSAATRTRPDPYSSRAFVSSHSRKLANAQTERSVAATSTVLVTESVLSSAYQHCYWMFLSRSPIATTDSRTRIDSYSSRAFVSNHSRKLANAQKSARWQQLAQSS